MNAEALLGANLGSCVLQRLLGEGTMGAVYLAQQSRPQRQVAVKIFLRAATLEPEDLADFLRRLQREIDAVASLKHPDILAIYECGEHNGLPYLITPYIAGGTLQTLLQQEGPLSLPTVASYLGQLSVALDFVHEHGILHQDIKPSNILITSDGRLLLTDFGLARTISEGKLARMRLPVPGMLDYLAPEQVLGRPLDARADLYSLGAVLYHMVTGSPPFQGSTLTDVAMKHVQAPLRSPRSLRPELPLAAEQALMRALAKRPADRYAYNRDLASAFNLTLSASGITDIAALLSGVPQDSTNASSDSTGSLTRIYTPRGLFDPHWQTDARHGPSMVEAPPAASLSTPKSPRSSASIAAHEGPSAFKKLALRPEKEKETPLAVQSTIDPATPVEQQPFTLPHFHTQGTLPTDIPGNTGAALPQIPAAPQVNTGTFQLPDNAQANTGAIPPTGNTAGNQGTTGDLPSITNGLGNTASNLFQLQQTASSPDNSGTTSTIKLTSPVKIIQVPVAGQPGRYVTGFLPMLPPEQTQQSQEAPQQPADSLGGRINHQVKGAFSNHLKLTAAILVIVLILVSSGIFWLARPHSNQTAQRTAGSGTPDVRATATVQAKATAEASIILSDPLSQNIHNWPVTSNGQATYTFKDGAYHIINNDTAQSAPAILPDEVLTRPFTYTLTMEEIKGDEGSVNNEFGLILRATTVTKKGKLITMFYTFEVLNKSGGEYQFWKYDGSQGGATGPWKMLWNHSFGHEFHQGHGTHSSNTFKVLSNGKNFTLIVNGKQVGTLSDGSIASGQIGMLVNLKGTEVAFSNLLLTY